MSQCRQAGEEAEEEEKVKGHRGRWDISETKDERKFWLQHEFSEFSVAGFMSL